MESDKVGKAKLPKGHMHGVAVHESFHTVIAYVVEAQIQGTALMGLGTTLPGAAITLKDDVVEQQNVGDYVAPRMNEMPQIDVHLVPSQDAPTGMGEPGLPPLAPAFANAVFKLTGKRLCKLPFDLASA